VVSSEKAGRMKIPLPKAQATLKERRPFIFDMLSGGAAANQSW
jgi:hypothetical protein